MRRWRLLILALAAVGLAVLIVWLAARPPRVIVARATRGDLAATLSATGVVETPESEVAPTVVGRISTLLVREGDPVRTGQVVARLSVPELQAAVTRAQAELQAARAEASSWQATLKQQRITAVTTREQAEARLREAEAGLQELRAGSRPQEVRQAEEALAAARADLTLAQAQAQRAERLLAEGALAQADVDQARARLATARARVAEAEQELSLVRQGARPERIAAAQAEVAAARAQVRAAQAAAREVQVVADRLRAAQARVEQARAALSEMESQLSEAWVRAPISGRVSRRLLDVGDLAGPANPILIVANNRQLWVVAEVDEEDVELLHPGQHVTITAEALPDPLTGTVAEVGAAATPRGPELARAKVVRSRILLAETSPLLRAGMDVDVSSRAVLAREVVTVPVAAVSVERGRAYVWVVESGRAYRRPVELGRRTYERAAVSSGLRAGQWVVVSGRSGLRSGQRVASQREGGDGG